MSWTKIAILIHWQNVALTILIGDYEVRFHKTNKILLSLLCSSCDFIVSLHALLNATWSRGITTTTALESCRGQFELSLHPASIITVRISASTYSLVDWKRPGYIRISLFWPEPIRQFFLLVHNYLYFTKTNKYLFFNYFFNYSAVMVMISNADVFVLFK